MQALRNILHLMLVLAILSTGLPFHHPADANRDNQVDLADAILRVRDIVQTADHPSSFKSSLEDALLTLSSVAGVKKVIKADRSQAVDNTATSQISYLIPSDRFILPSGNGIRMMEETSPYRSVSILPETPPPRFS